MEVDSWRIPYHVGKSYMRNFSIARLLEDFLETGELWWGMMIMIELVATCVFSHWNSCMVVVRYWKDIGWWFKALDVPSQPTITSSGWWFGTWMDYDFPFSWEFHDPNWRTPSFFRGVGLNQQPVLVWLLLGGVVHLSIFGILASANHDWGS